MVKIICITGFIVGLVASALRYTVEYFGVKDAIEQEKIEMGEKNNG